MYTREIPRVATSIFHCSLVLEADLNAFLRAGQEVVEVGQNLSWTYDPDLINAKSWGGRKMRRRKVSESVVPNLRRA
jgi:hypothetical protein